jgi:hypothetical protein
VNCYLQSASALAVLRQRNKLVVVVLNLGLQQASAFVIFMLLSLFFNRHHSLGFCQRDRSGIDHVPIIISMLLAVQTAIVVTST